MAEEKQDLKTTVDKIVSGSVDQETIDAIVDAEPEEEIFGETLGGTEETKPKEEEPLISPQEAKKPEVVAEPVKPVEELKKAETEKVADVVPEKPDELDAQIKAAVEAALPKEEPNPDDYRDRFFNTQQYATQVNQENVTLRQGINTVETQLAEAVQQLKDAGIEITPQRPQVQQRTIIQDQGQPQYQPPVQPRTDPRLEASLASAESKFTAPVVDDYLHPQNGKFHKMVAKGNSAEIFQKVNASLDPLVEAINLTKEWEQKQEHKTTQTAEDRGALIDSIVAKVREQIGIGGQTNGGKSTLPTNLSDVRADSNIAKKPISAEPQEEIFNEYLG